MSQGQAFDSTASVHEFLVADVIQDRTGKSNLHEI